MTHAFALNDNNVAWRLVDGEAVIINTKTTYYYSLNQTGTFVWQLLGEQPHSLEQLIEKVAAYYVQPPDSVRADVIAIIEHLEQEELIVRGQ